MKSKDEVIENKSKIILNLLNILFLLFILILNFKKF